MTYLLSQIFVSLLLAAVAGGALGWILNGIKAHRRERELSGLINRHASALSQAQQERQMIADDYDEMKLGLESRIGELQLETRKLPELEANLEKSQQLVQQMMKTHKSELSDTQAVSEQLKLELENLRVQQKNDTSEISALRKANAELGGNNNLSEVDPAGTKTRAAAGSIPGQSNLSNQNTNNENDDKSNTAATDQSDQPGETATYQRAHGNARVTTSAGQLSDSASVIPTENAIPAEINPIDESALNAAATQAELLELESEIEEMRGFNRDHSVPAVDSRLYSEQPNTTKTTKAETTAESKAQSKAESKADGPNHTASELRNRFKSESLTAEADDLQTIHGIGPLIEKSLNDLGIINYQQIAELTRREVEEIAEILEIFPGRIERDNWIGSARKLAGQSQGPSTESKNTEDNDTEVRNKIKSPALQAEEV